MIVAIQIPLQQYEVCEERAHLKTILSTFYTLVYQLGYGLWGFVFSAENIAPISNNQINRCRELSNDLSIF